LEKSGLLAVSQYDALFSLLGTIYGGDGRTTFGLPDLRGRLPIHAGSGPGLTPRNLGVKSGTEIETLSIDHLPNHNHNMKASSDAGTQNNPHGEFLAASPNVRLFRPAAPNVALNNESISNVGGSQEHQNLMPYLCIHFIIALFGVYPSRT
jgi:microcystin-dependent protein